MSIRYLFLNGVMYSDDPHLPTQIIPKKDEKWITTKEVTNDTSISIEPQLPKKYKEEYPCHSVQCFIEKECSCESRDKREKIAKEFLKNQTPMEKKVMMDRLYRNSYLINEYSGLAYIDYLNRLSNQFKVKESLDEYTKRKDRMQEIRELIK